MAIASTNPATGQVLKAFQPLTHAEIEAKLARAAQAFSAYRKTTFDERARWLVKAAEAGKSRL